MSSEFKFLTQILPVVKRRARRIFAMRAERADRIADAISLAWEGFIAAPDKATASSLSYYACSQVIMRRQFKESQRSATGPNQQRKPKPERLETGLNGMVTELENPAEIAALRIDFAAWVETLTEREKDFLHCFLFDESTKAIAEHFRVSPGRVSQIRRELLEHWQAFIG